MKCRTEGSNSEEKCRCAGDRYRQRQVFRILVQSPESHHGSRATTGRTEETKEVCTRGLTDEAVYHIRDPFLQKPSSPGL